MIAVYLLYAFSELLSLALGLLLWKRHSAFPDFRLGYHVAEAMQGEAQWNAANACAGKVSLFGGLLAFVFFPCMPAPEIIHWTHGAALLLHLPSMGAFRFKDSPILLEKKISEQRKEISKAAPGVRRGPFSHGRILRMCYNTVE